MSNFRSPKVLFQAFIFGTADFYKKKQFIFKKDDFLMKRMVFYKKGDFFLNQTKKIVDN